MNLYVALLRGINVGGKNLIAMPALKTCFETRGYCDVSTYIQSGNVLFMSRRGTPETLTTAIEQALSKTFAYQSRVVLRSYAQMKSIVDDAPRGFGRRPAEYRYDVIFLKAPLTAEEAVTVIPNKPEVDRIVAGDGVVYASRLVSKASESRLNRVAGIPAYKNMTVRNWNTTTKLAELMERMQSRSSG